ncbi:MAG: hypothetical protein J6X58_01750 [Bacteroidales bacterium]|nr:hypothetical protein [Bacteroidales bacterium]
MDEELVVKARKRSLRIVLALSIIGSGISCFLYLYTGIMLPSMKADYLSGAVNVPGEWVVFVEQLLETPRSFFLCAALLYGMSLAGVVMMWGIRKNGFHMYTLAQLLILLVTLLFLGRERLDLGNVMLTLLFIVYYYISLRNLGVFNKEIKAESSADDEEKKSE